MANVKKSVTILDVAKNAGVSPSTVSIILNGKGAFYRISGETMDRVLSTAARMNYRTNLYAKNLVMRSTDESPIVGVFWENFYEQGPLKEFCAGLMTYNSECSRNFQLAIHPYTAGNLSAMRKIIDLGLCQGAIVTGFAEADREFLLSVNKSIPLVLFNRDLEDINAVYSDNYAIGQQAAENLLCWSPTSLVCINPSTNNKNPGIRFAGFYDTCIRSGIPGDMISVFYDSNTDEGGFAAAERLIAACKPPIGVFISGDCMLGGCVKSLIRHGLRIPGDAYVVCFGNNVVCEVMTPSITSIFLPSRQMGYDCLKMIDLSLSGVVSSGTIKTHKGLLTYRESCPEQPEAKE